MRPTKGKKEKKKKKEKKNVLSLSTGQGRDEVCRALHRTDARAFHKNTLEYSYQTIISRFRSPTLYILLACYIVYPDFFFPLLLVFRIRVRSLLFLVSATAIDAVGQSVQTLRFDHLPLRSLHPIHPFFQEDILPLSWCSTGYEEESGKKKKGKRKGEDLLSRRDDDFDSFPFRVDLRRNARRFYAASFPMFVLMDEGEEIGRKG